MAPRSRSATCIARRGRWAAASRSTAARRACASCQGELCEVGTGIGPRGFNALIGLNSFSGDALRLHLATSEIFILPDVAGSEIHRSRSCDAVLPGPFRGGGTLVLGGTELGFANW